jgi:UPF0716 family protein affecting phage T7 exclusion
MENQDPVSGSQYFNNQQIPLPNSTTVLVLGIVSLIGCFCYGIPGIICSIIALVLSSKDNKLYAAQPGLYTPASYKNLKSGRICAIIGIALSVLYILLLLVFGAAMLSNYPEILRNMQRQ